MLTAEEREKSGATIIIHGKLNVAIVVQPVTKIAEIADIKRP